MELYPPSSLMTCATLYPYFKRAVSVAIACALTNPSMTNRFPIVAILSLISVDIVFNRLSNVRLLGDRYAEDNPHAFTILLLYGKSKHRR